MAGPLQAGDIINFGRLAWEVYQLGWSEDHNATKHYTEFGKDVKSLAESLDILTQVVCQARSTLQRQGAYNSVVRWDRSSLREIIGDYEETLQECGELLHANRRYRVGSGPLRNIEWNVLVQPSVDRLRERIVLHNSKVLHVLKPFEIDLLCRVRQDIYRVHQDLASRIAAVHLDLHRLMGVMIPNLGQALDQQAQRQVHLLDVPLEIADRFRVAALSDRPEYESDDGFELQELSDAFILNYNRSTIGFRGGLLVADKIPPVDQYLNLLKCVWLYSKISSSPTLANAREDSHWPSYARQLEDDLSAECSRYGQDLVEPQVITTTLRRDVFSVWPEKDPPQLVDVVTRDEVMEEILATPLSSSVAKVDRSVKLLRRMGSDGRRFRVIISGTEQTASGRPRVHKEVIDFDVNAAVLKPQYALPSSSGIMREVILQRDERIARLAFTSLSHVLKFQQAVTGYKAWASYTQYDAMVSFVLSGLREPVVEKACIQLWIPKVMDGSLVKNTDESSDSDLASTRIRSPTQMSTSTFTTAMLVPQPRHSETGLGTYPMARQTSQQSYGAAQSPPRNSTTMYTPWPRTSSPVPMGSSPPGRLTALSSGSSTVLGSSRQQTVGSVSSQGLGSSPPLARVPVNGKFNERSASISSAVSTPVSHATSSSSSNGHTIVVPTGAHTTGFLHRRPPKPKLVIFTEGTKDGQLSMVSIDIDEETAVNPERCNCRRAGKDGSSCPIAAIERRKGDANLEARRYETSSTSAGSEWNVARLAINNPASSDDVTTWSRLRRLSIMFPRPEDRITFGGTPNQCRCRIKNEGELSQCMRLGHRGLWGEVQEHYRREMNKYHAARYEVQKHVVNGLMD
ncbi:hypothetical protein HJFPF1_09254 [Paramyrothecium foliicola]|nr:hypothetical protein HJFPF1_09254 [Paramyrothecium foliicola]